MTWFRVDDKLHDHHKARKAGKAAMGVWVLCGSWSSDHLEDGFVPEAVLLRHGSRSDAKRLVDADLWSTAMKNGERGWQFHDWADLNPSRDTVLAERDAARERQRKARDKSRESRRDIPRDIDRESPCPDPTRPDLEPPQPPAERGATNPRALGTNPRGPKPPDPADVWLANRTEDSGVA